ncbi:MAG: hypothetical protein IKF19_00195 [Bacilli bacterium]|nr:hypothetical protein [Bacilli bacterium]
MERSDSKGGLVVGILIGIIIMLVVGIGLVATNIVSFNGKASEKSENTETNNKQESEFETDEEKRVTTDREEAVTKLKEVLTNDTWVKENLYSKKNCFGEDASDANHELTFEVLTDDNSNPIVIVLDDAPNDFIRDAFKVYYYNGEVKVKKVIDGMVHPGHGGFIVDIKQNLVIVEWGHMGDYAFTAYDVKSDEIKKYDEYRCDTGNCEYEYKGEKIYNTTGIDKKLNVDNINTYLK